MRVYVCVYIYIYSMTDLCFVLNYSKPYQHPKSPPTWRLSPRQAGLMTIRTDDMETAGEMVQDLCSFLQVQGRGGGLWRKWGWKMKIFMGGLEDEDGCDFFVWNCFGIWVEFVCWSRVFTCCIWLIHIGWWNFLWPKHLSLMEGDIKGEKGNSVGCDWRLISGFRRLHGVLKWPYITCIGNVFEWFAHKIVQCLGESFLVNPIKPQKTIKTQDPTKTCEQQSKSSLFLEKSQVCFLYPAIGGIISTQPLLKP